MQGIPEAKAPARRSLDASAFGGYRQKDLCESLIILLVPGMLPSSC